MSCILRGSLDDAVSGVERKMTMVNDTKWSLTTRLVHEGERGARTAGTPTSMPIYATATYIHPSAQELDQAFSDGGLVYGRYGNPTVNGFEAAVALLEGGVGAVAFGSGMAALHAAILAAGTPRGATQPSFQHVLAARDMYGTTRTLLHDFFGAQGITTEFVDMSDMEAVRQSFAARQTDVVVLEPISNPLLKLVDLPALIGLCREAGARLVVDNTLPTPLMLRPLTLGADFAVHSATKYLGGHGDVIGGVVVARSRLPLDNVRAYSKLLGAVLGPFDARLLARGVKTLSLRFRQQCASAAVVASWLNEQPQVARVYYPGLPCHPQHDLAQQLFGDCGGAMIAFDLRPAEQKAVFRFMDALELFLPATSLGDIYSLVTYPVIASHRDLTPEQRAGLGIGDGLLRLSIGIEDAADLIADLGAALAKSQLQ